MNNYSTPIYMPCTKELTNKKVKDNFESPTDKGMTLKHASMSKLPLAIFILLPTIWRKKIEYHHLYIASDWDINSPCYIHHHLFFHKYQKHCSWFSQWISFETMHHRRLQMELRGCSLLNFHANVSSPATAFWKIKHVIHAYYSGTHKQNPMVF